MMDNNLDNGWTLKDLPRLAWGNIREWWQSITSDREMIVELAGYVLVACLVGLFWAALYWLGKPHV